MRVAECSHLAMRVYLHLFWGEDSEKPGFGRCAPSLLADTLDSSKRAVVAALDELQSKGLIVWSADERLAYRPGFAQRFKPAQPAMVNNWHDTAARLRDGVIASQVREEIGPRVELHYERSKQSNSKPNTEYLSIPSVSSVSTIPSKDLPADAGAPVAPTPTRTDTRFKAPTLEEATAYFAERGFPAIEAQRFCDFYASKGWKVGKTPMKDWQAAVRNWTRDKQPQQPAQQQRLSYEEQADILNRHYNDDED